MAYATADDVRRLMAHFTIGATTQPTATQVDTVIADTEHEVNVALASRKVTPVPFTVVGEFLSWLKLVVSYGATAAILKSMFPSATGPGETPAYAFWESRYKAAMKGIADGSLVPTEFSSTAVRPSTYFVRNPSAEENIGDVAEPWFKRESVPSRNLPFRNNS